MLVLYHYTNEGKVLKVIYCHYTNSEGQLKLCSLCENDCVFLRGIASFLVKVPISFLLEIYLFCNLRKTWSKRLAEIQG